jgi:two-component system phosphate regulon response regulator OmpR
MTKKHLLIVDDDERIRKLLKQFLTKSGYRISTAADSAIARQLNQNLEFDMLIVDIMMPGEDGLSLTRSLSKENHIPILLLSAKVEASERILGLEMGADDYLSKPFEPRELLLRVDAILKRSTPKLPTSVRAEVSIGQFKYNLSRQELWQGTIRINLTSSQTKLLQILAQRSNSAISRDELLTSFSIHKFTNSGTENTIRSVDVQIKRLRQKIELDPKNPRYLKTVRGYGYILKPDS